MNLISTYFSVYNILHETHYTDVGHIRDMIYYQVPCHDPMLHVQSHVLYIHRNNELQISIEVSKICWFGQEILLILSKKINRVNNSLHLRIKEMLFLGEWISLDFNSSRVRIHYSTSETPSGSLGTPREVIIDVTTQGVTSVTNRLKIHSILLLRVSSGISRCNKTITQNMCNLKKYCKK